MRNGLFGVSGIALASVAYLSFSGAAMAGIDCRDYAKMTADIATRDILQPAAPGETAQPGRVTVIAAGRKFTIPAHRTDANALAPMSVWDRTSTYGTEWRVTYDQAFTQCALSRNNELPLR